MTQLNPDVASVILEFANYFERAVLFDILFPGSRRLCYNRNLQEINTKNSTEYQLFGNSHRENDMPAIEWKSGSKKWYINDKLHRDMDKPAFIRANGDKEWYIDGQFIRASY